MAENSLYSCNTLILAKQPGSPVIDCHFSFVIRSTNLDSHLDFEIGLIILQFLVRFVTVGDCNRNYWLRLWHSVFVSSETWLWFWRSF